MVAADIVKYRLTNQQIAVSKCKTAGEVVSCLGAMQAQDYNGALWSIGLRMPGSTLADVNKAIADRAILRTWPMRGTLHFVAAEDARWMLQLMAPRIVAGRVARHRDEFGFDEAKLAKCEKIVTKELQGGRQKTRDELMIALDKAGIHIDEHMRYLIIWRLASECIICFGSHQGKQATFALFDEWVSKSKKLARDAALAEIALRYFTSHGPATLKDFIWWTGLKAAEARAGVDMIAGKLIRETIDGTEFLFPETTPSLQQSSPTAYLLPGFDEYLLGYTDRTAAVEKQHAAKLAPGNNGIFKPTLVIDGRVKGIWQRVVKKNSSAISHQPFANLRRAELTSITTPIKRYGDFHGMTATLAD